MNPILISFFNNTFALPLTGIHCWDMAAGALIVSEAGGVVLDPSSGGEVGAWLEDSFDKFTIMQFDLMSRDILVCSSKELSNKVGLRIKTSQNSSSNGGTEIILHPGLRPW